MLQLSLKKALEQRSQKSLTRQRKVRSSPVSPKIVVQGKSYLNFASSDYLGLANDPRVVTAFKQAVDQYGVGSGAASVVSGYTAAHQALEERLADFLGYPKALIFSTGYMTNLGILTALSPHFDFMLQDKQCHASLVDGGRFSQIAFERYLHSSPKDLAKRLEKNIGKSGLVVTDGVFSVRGDMAPLPAIIETTQRYSTCLMVDDAHGIGVLGREGRGSLEYFQLPATNVDILVGTFGKAFGTFGAFVAADSLIIEALIQFARSYLYTTALPPAIVVATQESLKIIQSEYWRRENLQALITYFQKSAKELDIAYEDSKTAIQSISIGKAEDAVIIGNSLAEQGLYVAVMRPPTTLPHKSCLRVTLTALHRKTDIDQLLSAISRVCRP